MATNASRPKAPLSTSAMAALIFGFIFAPLAVYFGLRTYEETKPGDVNRAWASAGLVLAAIQVFVVIAYVVASLVVWKSGHGMPEIYYAPGPFMDAPFADNPTMHRMG